MPEKGRSIRKLPTEQAGGTMPDLGSLSVKEIMKAINDADRTVPSAVGKAIPSICAAGDVISSAVNSGRRIFYLGAGTGGRVGAQDAAELPPTYGFSPRTFQAIMAGGSRARQRAVEDAEDDTDAAGVELGKRKAGRGDVVLGITASGRTPFVVGGLKYAASAGCRTVALTSNPGSPVTMVAEISVVVETGPEVIAGSTRMKAGTAQKLVLNMLSTYAGIRAGRVIGNRMVGMKATNEKLRVRAAGIVEDITGCSPATAKRVLKKFDYDIRKSIEHIGGRK